MKSFVVLCSLAVVLVSVTSSPSSANRVHMELIPGQPEPEVTRGISADSHAPVVKRNALPDDEGACWWTGCQMDTWATRGCSQYGMAQTAHKQCSGGTMYYCC